MRPRHSTIGTAATALVLLLTACGSGDDSDTREAASEPAPDDASQENDADSGDAEIDADADADADSDPEPAGPATFTSNDELLTVTDPSGAIEITIDAAEPLAADDPAIPLVSYDLGPDGATFDTPVVVHDAVDDGARETYAFAVLHEHDDGTVETVEWEATDDGLRFELDSFSSAHIRAVDVSAITIDLPPTIEVGEQFPGQLDLPGTSIDGDIVVVNSSDDGFSATGDLSYAAPQFSCNEPTVPDSVASYNGPVSVELGDEFRVLTDFETSTNVQCTSALTRPDATDSQRVVRATGEPVDGTLSPDPNIGFATGNGVLSAEVTVGPGVDATLAVGGVAPDGDYRYVEIREGGEFVGFLRSGFNFTPDESFAAVTETEQADGGRTIRYELQLPCGEPVDYRFFPGGVDMNDQPLEPMFGMLVDVTFFLQDADGIQDTRFFDPTSQPIIDSMAFSTCP